MSGSDSNESSGVRGASARWVRDWRVWLGIVITAVAFWFAIRGVPLEEVGAAMGQANLPLIFGVSIPSYILALWVRALRWRHLTEPIAPMERGTIFRAIAIGFMVNNLLPLRLGELVRTWYLARETGTRVSAILGSVVLERIIDVASVLALAAISLFLLGGRFGDGGILAEGAWLLAPVGLAPLLGLFALKLVPEWVLAVVRWLSKPLPARLAERIDEGIREFINGLGALSGGLHLFWIVLHSATIWMLLSTIPFVIALVAFGVEMGSLSDLFVVSWALLATVGVAVSIPSAPGFFGTYQLAFKALLVEFGVDPALALAMGLLVWFIFWSSLTVLGLIVLRVRGTSLGELTQQAGKDPSTDRR